MPVSSSSSPFQHRSVGSSNQALGPRELNRRMAMYAALEGWEYACLPGSDELRGMAVMRIKDCCESGAMGLNLISLKLSSLPPLPEHLTILLVSKNKLKSLPTLPPRLEILDVGHNLLERLPVLPASLVRLDAGNNLFKELHLDQCTALVSLDVRCNQLTVLPLEKFTALLDLNVKHNQLITLGPSLPDSLTDIEAGCNLLQGLPEKLPDDLLELGVENNLITALPLSWPPGLTKLIVRQNRLMLLPETLPDCLSIIDVNDNKLTALPLHLPAGLLQLKVARNLLTSLPDKWPTGLLVADFANNRLRTVTGNFPLSVQEIDLSHNQITALPDAMFGLSWGCLILVRHNPFPVRVLLDMHYAMTQQSYHGPKFRLPDFLTSDIVFAWHPQNQHSAIEAQWVSIREEEGAADFMDFLVLLDQTVNHSVPAFNAYIAEWLVLLAITPSLRERTFIAASYATESCEDRLSLTFLALQNARVIHDIDSGKYDNQLSEVTSISRKIFREKRLAIIASELMNAHSNRDEIEVYLALPVMLREVLQLSTSIEKMAFFKLANLGDADLASAALRVKTEENEQFLPWLCQWEPWENMAKRIDKDGFDVMQNTLYELLDTSFDSLMKAALAQFQMDADTGALDDASRVIGKKIIDEISIKVKTAYTKKVFAQRSLAHLLDPMWII